MKALPEAEIFDVDGTLCNVQAIRHFVRGGKDNGYRKDFNAFHQESVNCPANPQVVEGVKAAVAAGRQVLVVTARSTRYRNHTAFWLALNGIHSDRLFMRREGDFRVDVSVKDDIYRSISARWNIVRAWDDNPSIIGLWEGYGIPVEKVPGWEIHP